MFENLSMIACIDYNTNGIGFGGKLLYNIPEDMKFFKHMTNGKTVICGRKTYESLPIKPLPNRNTIVLTSKDFTVPNNVYLADKEQIRGYLEALNIIGDDCYIIGGENVYKEYISLCSKLYITEVISDEVIICDTYFPKINEDEWKLIEHSSWKKYSDKIKYRFTKYIRK